MNDNPISSSTISVQMAYDNYLKNKYIVNRKYQRKLVWTLEEKAAFIDSLSNGILCLCSYLLQKKNKV